MTDLRRALTKVGGDYKVYKNTLVRRASHDIGLAELDAMLTGPTAIAFVDGDVAQVAKVLRDFARTNPNLVVKGGLLGTSMLDARGAAALAELPSRDTLLAQLAGMLAAPMQQFAALLQAVPSKLAYGLSALIDERRKTEPVEEAPAVAVEAATQASRRGCGRRGCRRRGCGCRGRREEAPQRAARRAPKPKRTQRPARSGTRSRRGCGRRSSARSAAPVEDSSAGGSRLARGAEEAGRRGRSSTEPRSPKPTAEALDESCRRR